MLIIHPKDRTTSVLSTLYEGIRTVLICVSMVVILSEYGVMQMSLQEKKVCMGCSLV